MNQTKLGILVLIGLTVLIFLGRWKIPLSKTFAFDFRTSFLGRFSSSNQPLSPLEPIIQKNLTEDNGTYAVVIEPLPRNATESGQFVPYYYNQEVVFPAASLYKLVLLAASLKNIQEGSLSLDDQLSASKSHLTEIFGDVDFGYEDWGENISYSVEEALQRIGRISDNFAAIMLSERIRSVGANHDSPANRKNGSFMNDPYVGQNKLSDPLSQMASDLGMSHTSFASDIPTTTASDIAVFFKKLYLGQIVNEKVSGQIIKYLALSQLNDRIPAGLPKEVRVIHKTGELSGLRHDAGIIYLPGDRSRANYLIVFLSQDLTYEDDGVETLAKISKEVYFYISGLGDN